MAGGREILRKLAIAASRMPGRRRLNIIKPGRRKPNSGGAGEVSPVEPNRPNNLSGGAAAALEFDE